RPFTSAWSRRVTEMRHQLSLEKRGRRGQSLAEMAVVIPVLVFLLMGGFDATMLIANKITAGYAVRQGARLAAELGGSQTNPGATTLQIDRQIARNALAVARSMNAVTLKEVDIYAPTKPDGSYTAGDPVDQYFVSPDGSLSAGSATFRSRTATRPLRTRPRSASGCCGSTLHRRASFPRTCR